MAEEASSAQSQQIDTSQPTPLKNLKIRGVKKVETVNTIKKGAGPEGEDIEMCVNKADYNEELHGQIVEAKLPTRKKAKKKADEEDDDE